MMRCDNGLVEETEAPGKFPKRMVMSMCVSKTTAVLVLSALLATGLSPLMLPQEASAAKLVTRSERCERLQRQLQSALSGHFASRQARQAEILLKKGTRFCASKRQAQGLRAYAEGLKRLGLKPNMDDPEGSEEEAIPPSGKPK